MLSVIIPAYNEESIIENTLKSYLDQDFAGQFEIIVVDNNSTDKTSDKVLKFAKQHPQLSLRLVQEKRPGVGAVRYRGSAQARFPIIANVDADAIPNKDWLSKITLAFQKNPNLAAIGGLVIYQGKPLFTKLHRWFQRLNWLIGRPTFVGVNFIVTREAMNAVGGFDICRRQNEDYDLSMRLAKKFGKSRVVLDDSIIVISSSRRFHWSFKNIKYFARGFADYLKLLFSR